MIVENIVCPVCNKNCVSLGKLSSHMMNSYLESLHSEFIKKQDEKIREIYVNNLYINFIIEEIVLEHSLICSPTYVRNIFKTFSDYKEKLSVKRSNDTSDQYYDGRRAVPTSFNNGWKLTKENGGKRYIEKEKYDKIIELYNSKLTQKEVSEMMCCKCDTIHKIWVKSFGESEVHIRNMNARSIKIIKLTPQIKTELNNLFYEDVPKAEIAKRFEISGESVSGYYKTTFSKEERKERQQRLQKYAIRKSLIACGKKGKTGSQPENYCFDLLCQKINEKVIHHDFDLCPPYEIDISIPSLKTVISWDGPFHRSPFFGQKALDKTQRRDCDKIARILKNGWNIIVVEDNNSKFDPTFVENKVDKIIDLLNSNWRGKEII